MNYNFYGLDHVQLAAPEGCEAEARRFFHNLMGWTEIPKPETLKKTWWRMVSMWNSSGSYWSTKRFCARYQSSSSISRSEPRLT